MSSGSYEDTLLKFYEADYHKKVDYLTSHFGRMWTRFNFFLTIESALFVLSFNPPENTPLLKHSIQIAIIGGLLCIVWYIFGAQDRHLVALYRKQVELSGTQIKETLNLPDYYHIGQTKDIQGLNIQNRVYQWRINAISITKLAAYFPMVVIVIWVATLVTIQYNG